MLARGLALVRKALKLGTLAVGMIAVGDLLRGALTTLDSLGQDSFLVCAEQVDAADFAQIDAHRVVGCNTLLIELSIEIGSFDWIMCIARHQCGRSLLEHLERSRLLFGTDWKLVGELFGGGGVVVAGRGGVVPLFAGHGQQQIECIVHWVRLSIKTALVMLCKVHYSTESWPLQEVILGISWCVQPGVRASPHATGDGSGQHIAPLYVGDRYARPPSGN